MLLVKMRVLAWLGSEPFPGIVEVELIDARGRNWRFVDKAPIFAGDLRADGVYPVDILVGCTELSRTRTEGRELVTISTAEPWGIESREGCWVFEVTPDQLMSDATPAT